MSGRKVDIIASIGAQDRTGNAFRQVNQKLNGMQATSDKTSRAVNNNFRMMRGGAAQFGFQIQDIAVQLQGGQNALLVFGQQGSQIASLFGTGGAVAGAIVAVGAALATAFLPRLFGAEKALADMNTQMSIVRGTMKLTADDTGILTKEFEELAAVSEDLARNALLSSYNAALLAVNESQRQLKASTEDIGKSLWGLTTSPINRVAADFDIARNKAAALYNAVEKIQSGNAQDGIPQLESVLNSLIDPLSGANSEFRVMAGELLTVIEQYHNANASADQLTEALGKLNSGQRLNTESSESNRAAVADMVAAIEKEAEVIAMTTRARVIYDAVQKGATASDLEQIARAHDKIAAYEAEQRALQSLETTITGLANRAEAYAESQLAAYNKSREAAVKLLESEQNSLLTGVDAINSAYDRRLEIVRDNLSKVGAEKERFAELEMNLERARAEEINKYHEDAFHKEMLLYQARFQAAGQLAGALAGIFSEGSKEQRAFLAVQKGLAVGEAIMNMHRAISNANALPWPANLGAIAQAASTGLGAISGIRAVSFEGGGFTGYGARAGGLDGKGGMPAIVHPNETIIDHTKGGGEAVNVNFTIVANDTRGFSRLLEQNKGQIMSIVSKAANNRGRRSSM